MPLHEGVEVVLFAPGPPVHHVVEIGKHVLDPLETLGLHVLQPPGEPVEVGVQHFPAQCFHELPEASPCIGRRPSVVGQVPDRARRVPGKGVEHRLLEAGAVVIELRQLEPLEVEDLVQPGAHLFQGAGEVEPLGRAAARFLKAAAEILEPPEPPLEPPLLDAAEGLSGARSLEDVLCHRLENLPDIDV